MSAPKTVLLLNGSPRCESSTSRLIAQFLIQKLEQKGLTSKEAFLARLSNSTKGQEKILELTSQADIVVLATPLYVDSLPSFTISALETIAQNQKTNPSAQKKSQLLIGVMNCGFPEKEHMDIAFQILKNFASETGFVWGGSIQVGWGAALNGQPLQEGKGMTRHLTKGLSIAADSLATGQPATSEAEALVSKPFLPIFIAKNMMRLMGKRMWNQQVNKNAKNNMYAKPYEQNQ